MSKETEQHQGEPVVMPERKRESNEESDVLTDCQNEGWNACLDEIAKLGPLYTHPAPADQQEPVGVVVSAQDSGFRVQWSAGIWPEQMPVGTKLYTQADPGEVVHLRAELVEWKERCQRNNDEAMRWMAKHDALRAKLAERDELLRELDDAWNSHDGKERFYKLMAKIEVLPASAEPSAPVEVDERAEFVDAWNKRGIDPVEAILIPSLTDDSFANVRARDAYWGWKARAALERKS